MKVFTIFGLIIVLVQMFQLAQAFRLQSSSIARSVKGRYGLQIRDSMTRLMSTSEEGKKTEAGHQPPPGHKGPAMPEMSPEDMEIVNNFREHQKGAARISMAEEVRTLIDKSLAYGVLSTNSNSLEGYPTGSVVGFEVDDEGKPFFVFSTMSAHTTDILKDGKSSLTVMASDFKGAAEGRVVIVGDVVKVFDDAEKAKLREKYLSRHKEAFWIDFGDFSYFRMKSMNTIRYIGGFAMAGSVTPEEYTSAKPDPVAGFASHVMGHMNDDHEDSTIAMVKHYCGIPVTEAKIIGMDRLGMTVNTKIDMAASGGGYTKVRLPFPREVTERKEIKNVIVEMTQASAPSS